MLLPDRIFYNLFILKRHSFNKPFPFNEARCKQTLDPQNPPKNYGISTPEKTCSKHILFDNYCNT